MPPRNRRGRLRSHRAQADLRHVTATGWQWRKSMKMTEEQQKLVGREFRHFKGNLYRLEGFAKDSETLEPMVIYRALYGEGGLWVRPAQMFFEAIERDGKRMKRFELIENKK